MNSEKYIGLDVHQATISVAVLVLTSLLIEQAITLIDLLRHRGPLGQVAARMMSEMAIFQQQNGTHGSARRCFRLTL
jgi:hypothetical protein